MADILRLSDETLASTYIYLSRYRRFQTYFRTPDPLDAYTLSLASLSLASKSNESPRRMREILFPAHRLLHQHSTTPSSSSNPIAEPLRVPSETYDTLRATLVQAELILLRVLGFELRVPSPLDYLSRYLERAMSDIVDVGEDYDRWGREEKEEYGVVNDVMETGIGRACRAKAVEACQNYELANFFPTRTVALGCLSVVLEDRGWEDPENKEEWIANISGRKVVTQDFDDVINVFKSSERQRGHPGARTTDLQISSQQKP